MGSGGPGRGSHGLADVNSTALFAEVTQGSPFTREGMRVQRSKGPSCPFPCLAVLSQFRLPTHLGDHFGIL